MNPTIVNNIKHVVVMMMENRSFDHILGAIPGVSGVLGNTYSNLPNPAEPANDHNVLQYPAPITVNCQPQFDPDHGFGGMMTEIFGPAATAYMSPQGALTGYDDANRPIPVNEAYGPTQTMCGYYSTNANQDSSQGTNAMTYFEYLPAGTTGRLNVLHTLAENFVVCDNWFCDTPSETFPNRFFVHAGTNMGFNDDNNDPSKNSEADLWNALTIYEQLDAIYAQLNGSNPGQANWAVYGWPGGIYDGFHYNSAQYDSDWFAYCNQKPFASQFNRDIANFRDDVTNGELPFYSFLMPSLNFPAAGDVGNSMHPSGDVRLGENYIAQVYNTLRNSAIWNNTLLIITFDENGGIYDHVTPPAAVPPDGFQYYGQGETNPSFDYSLLGPRIPAILVSPWLANVNGFSSGFQVDGTKYQNSSIPRFVLDLFEAQNNGNASIGDYTLTARDASANSVTSSSFWLTEASTECPTEITIYTEINNNPIPPWGTCLSTASDCSPTGMLDAKPTEAALNFAKSSLFFYPGHADSGKPLTKEFQTNLELLKYMDERKEATRKHAQRGKPAPPRRAMSPPRSM